MNPNVSRTQVREELRKQWAAQAVEVALSGNWDGAAKLNQQILELFPDDIKAYNRLGKAYMELGRPQDALVAYEETLKRQASNSIARKRLAELYALLEKEPSPTLTAIPEVEEEIDEIEDEEEELEEEDLDIDEGDFDEE